MCGWNSKNCILLSLEILKGITKKMPTSCSPSSKGAWAKQEIEFKFTCWKAVSQIQRPLKMSSSSKIIENKMPFLKSVELGTGCQKGWDHLFMNNFNMF